MDNRYYFAYGSNMLRKRIENRLGKVEKITTYRLYGWKLALNCGITVAFANIIKTNNKLDFVEGVLYKLDEWQEEVLDYYEGFYFKQEFLNKKTGIKYYAYVALPKLIDKFNTIKPELYYINILLEGCEHNGFKKTFKKLLEFKTLNYNLRKNKHKRCF